MIDILFVEANTSTLYQELSKEFSAIETPTWSLLLAESCRSKGYRVNILDCNNKIWIDWPEKNLYGKNMEWKIVPICYCVPSDNINNLIWIDSVQKFIPTIYNFIKSLKNVKTALISRMGENVKLKYHQGWACVSNYVLRCHLPILVDENKSGVIVNMSKRYHVEGDYILFDDSLSHCGFQFQRFSLDQEQ